VTTHGRAGSATSGDGVNEGPDLQCFGHWNYVKNRTQNKDNHSAKFSTARSKVDASRGTAQNLESKISVAFSWLGITGILTNWDFSPGRSPNREYIHNRLENNLPLSLQNDRK
jgi:hypothetical protein